MGRSVGRLTARKVETLKSEGLYSDGGGLYLQIRGESKSKSWIFRFRDASKARVKGKGSRLRDMGLGPLYTLSLAEARQRATECRRQILDGFDPIAAREADRAKKRLEAARAITFKGYAGAYIKAHKCEWSSAKHSQQWESTLSTYAYPVLGALPLGGIDTFLILKVLEPIWTEKRETARRLRQRIEAILDSAKVDGLREGENPARWHGHLASRLAKRKVRVAAHHAALPYREIGKFMAALRAQEGVAARALEFAILTAARTNEILGASWAEIDLERATWTIPGARMKAGREHAVPLSAPAVALLKELEKSKGGPFVFPGSRLGKPLSNMAMLMTLRRMGRGDISVHGFRSSFRDWTAERTSYPREVAEAALAHAVGDKVEAAYLRTGLLDKRRKLMAAWGDYCSSGTQQGENVVALRAGATG